jgi:hypothetical protein
MVITIQINLSDARDAIVRKPNTTERLMATEREQTSSRPVAPRTSAPILACCSRAIQRSQGARGSRPRLSRQGAGRRLLRPPKFAQVAAGELVDSLEDHLAFQPQRAEQGHDGATRPQGRRFSARRNQALRCCPRVILIAAVNEQLGCDMPPGAGHEGIVDQARLGVGERNSVRGADVRAADGVHEVRDHRHPRPSELAGAAAARDPDRRSMAVSPRKRGRSYAPAWEPLGCEARRCQPLEPMQNRVPSSPSQRQKNTRQRNRWPRRPVSPDHWPDVPVLAFGPRMVCTRCGIGADARPNRRDAGEADRRAMARADIEGR